MRLLAVLCLLNLTAFSQTPSPALIAGPMLGHVSHEEVAIWLYARGTTVQLRYHETGTAAAEARHSVEFVADSGSFDRPFRFDLVDLTPNTEYDYDVLLDGAVVETGGPLRFKTLAQWRFRQQPADLVVAIGSCAYVNDQPFDRPGKAYGGSSIIFERIAAASPDLMLWLGDNVYFREPDYHSETGMARRYATHRRTPALQGLLRSTHHYAIWDDHDFGPNDSDRSFALKDHALRTFRENWANPPRSGETETGGNYTRFARNDVEFFLLDNRFFRSPNRAPDGPEKVMFGAEQMKWLIDSLTSSSAAFKVVAAGNQMMNPMTPYEGWGKFEDERKAFLAELERRRIDGVLFLSGDRHHTELIRIDRKGSYPLYDFTSSPLLSGVHRSDREANNRARVKDTWVNDKRNFGLLKFSGKGKERRLTMETRDASGKVLWRHDVPRNSLRHPKKR